MSAASKSTSNDEMNHGHEKWKSTSKDAKPMFDLRVVDNDKDEITVTKGGEEIRGWSYASETERRVKMLCAREFVEGWYQATEKVA